MTVRAIVGVWTLGLLAAGGAVTAAVTSDHTTNKAATIALALPTGLAFIASGLVAHARRPQNGTGGLLVLTGFTWFVAALPSANNSFVFTVGLVVGGLFIGVLAHLLLAFPSGRLASRTDRVIAFAMYTLVAAAPLVIFFFDEGELSTSFCSGESCPENLLATIPAQSVAIALAIVYVIGAVSLSVAVAVRLVLRWRRASPALRRSLAPVLLTAVTLIALFAVQNVVNIFSHGAAMAVNWLVLGATLALPLSFLYGLLRPWFTATTRRLVAELSEQRRPEDVQEVLRRALRDPTLELGYLTAAKQGYVDVSGKTLRLPGPTSGRTMTSIGEGIIVHDSALADQPELDEVVGAAHIALERGLSLRSLEASERRAEALIDAIPDNVYRVSADGTFLDAQAKGVIAYPETVVYPGVPVKDLIGRRIQEVMPAISGVVMEGLQRAIETGEVVTVEYAAETPIGIRDAEVRLVRSGDDEAVGIARDITDRKRQEAALEALNRVAVAVATEPRPERLFDIVTEEVGRLLDADAANLVRFDTRNEDEGVVVGKWSEPGVQIAEIGTRIELEGGAITRVRDSGRPARGGIDDPDNSPALVARLQALGVTSLVAAPIEVSGALWGAVVVSVTGEKSFADDAEGRIEQFAGLVAVALANAEARDGLAQLAAEQASLSRVAVAVAAERTPQRVFDVVTEEVGRLFRAQGANLVRYEDDPGSALVVGSWEAAEELNVHEGHRVVLDGPTPVALVRRTGKPARVDSFEGMPGSTAEAIRALGVRSAAAAPVDVGGKRWGAVVVTSGESAAFGPEAEERLAKFGSLVALAIANAEAHEEITASRARIVLAGDEERRRLERNLHDGAQQRLVTLSLTLRLAQSKLGDDAAARALLESASSELALALEELRELARGIHPAILSDRGLAAALDALATRAPVRVELRDVCKERLPPQVEAAAYYVVAESLTNVAKYAHASAAQVSVRRDNGVAIVEVEDDGIGGADASRGTGLRGLVDRVEALEGRLVLASEAGRGTRVRAEIPLVER